MVLYKPMITSDKDLPKLLGTPAKQVKWAKKLVIERLGITAKHVYNPPMQGMFSKTIFVTLKDDSEMVIQLGTEALDVDTFTTARGALGAYVTDSSALIDEELESVGAWAYTFTLMPGKAWCLGVAGQGPEGRITINKLLGHVFRRAISPVTVMMLLGTKLDHI
ncbi:hypothetical protein BGW36DRAFT_360314 [Talaromyces proteolyticus]|uniref:Uncharacterized protein n=1 Tax=Talaromyces proteolyticus TaxID=1131652 RepID=A0AAD4KTC0_9EURO|nr:uncharacterized protein BGW36DRAFT_360314 [Talaromyces proteolyticus]KAH8696480.1 hypothetical protein BGW36DRAFT_360314 [Talaromyces proteolyticus]